jgi:hypothetical protein
VWLIACVVGRQRWSRWQAMFTCSLTATLVCEALPSGIALGPFANGSKATGSRRRVDDRPKSRHTVFRNVSGDYRVLDPYGWHASGADPWERDARGTISSWLWKPGEAPALR